MKQKVVIKVSMNSHTSRFYCFGPQNPHSKALKVAGWLFREENQGPLLIRNRSVSFICLAPGVQSVALAGDQDRIEVTGDVDAVNLTTLLRKKVGFAEIVSVSKDKKESDGGDTPGITMDPQPMIWLSYPRREIVYLEDPYPQPWSWPL